MTLSASQKARLALVRSNNSNSSTSRAMVVRSRVVQQPLVVARTPATARRRARRRATRPRGSILARQTMAASAGASVVARPPVYSGGNPGELIISHEEILGSIQGGSFRATRDPMIPSQFAWLDGVSKNFSQFKWESLTAYFQTSVGTGINGEVALGWIFDWDSAPTDAIEAQCLHNNVASPPWSNLCVPTSVNTGEFGKPRYSYISHTQYENLDPNDCDTYVPCWLVSTAETSLGGVVGRVRVKYRIRLSNPIPSRMNDPQGAATVAGVSLRSSLAVDGPVQDPVLRLAEEMRGMMSGLTVSTTIPVIPLDPPITIPPVVSTFSLEPPAPPPGEDGRAG